MSSKRNLAAGVAVLGVAFGFPGAMQGQQRPEEPTTQEVLTPSEVLTGASVRLKVDGMVCPFCAYGLEKRIKKLSAVGESTINSKKGTMELFPKEGQHIEIDEVKDAVKSGGFTPREIRVALVGKLTEWNGETVL